jgi:hypothetical protein
LQLTWLKWLLPAGVFRRGFDQNHHQQRQWQQLRQGFSHLVTPLLAAHAAGDQELMQDVWFEAVDTLQRNGGDVQVRSLHTRRPKCSHWVFATGPWVITSGALAVSSAALNQSMCMLYAFVHEDLMSHEHTCLLR